MKERTATKSMLASKNTRPAVNTPQQGLHWIGVLGGELNVRLRDAREINPGLWPKTLVLGTRTGMFLSTHSISEDRLSESGTDRQDWKQVDLDKSHSHLRETCRRNI